MNALQRRTLTRTSDNWLGGRQDVSTYEDVPEDASRIWRHNFTSLIGQLIDGDSLHWRPAKSIMDAGDLLYALERGRLFLIALKADLESGMLDKIIEHVQAEVTADYLGMAERLLAEGSSGKNEHAPAAVLAGAVLERGLRELCQRQSPPILTKRDDGEPKTLNRTFLGST